MRRLIRETLLRWLKISLKIIVYIIIIVFITMVIVSVFDLEDGREGPIPTPYFLDQITPTPSQMTPTKSN